MANSFHSDLEGRHCYNFSVAYELTQIIDYPTRVPDVDNQYPNLLDIFLTTYPDLCAVTVLCPLGLSGHCLVSVVMEVKSKSSLEAPDCIQVFKS